jgi:hypothetical protein
MDTPRPGKSVKHCDSRVFVASLYVVDREIAIVRERQGRGEDVHFYPIVLSPTPEAGLSKVSDKNLRPRDAKPLSGFSRHERDTSMAEIANEIAAITVRLSKAAQKAQPVAPSKPPAGILVAVVDLPETGYEKLVGRDNELVALDAAWTDPNSNIMSLVAQGGAGKSALVNEWLVLEKGGGGQRKRAHDICGCPQPVGGVYPEEDLFGGERRGPSLGFVGLLGGRF